MPKKTLAVFCALLGILCFTQTLSAHPGPELSSKEKEVTHTDCEKTDSCSLKRVWFKTEEYHFHMNIDKKGSSHYGARMYAGYETSTPDALEDYAFVQFTRGCYYTSSINKDGSVRTRLSHVTLQFDSDREHYFPEWTVESTDTDPMYWTAPGYPRHYWYRWNESPDLTHRKTENWYGRKIPPFPFLYIRDLGTQAMFFSRKDPVLNVAVEYVIALYHTKDIPRILSSENIHFAQPLYTFRWRNTFVMNHETGQFENPSDVVSICRRVAKPSKTL